MRCTPAAFYTARTATTSAAVYNLRRQRCLGSDFARTGAASPASCPPSSSSSASASSSSMDLGSCIVTGRRGLSQQASRWLDKLRYGAEAAPSLGSWANAYEDNAMETRKLYCKALVHASGGSRLARDWIAGCAALTSPDPSLIYTALQHTATAEDVEELREHFLKRLLDQDEAADKSSGGEEEQRVGDTDDNDDDGGDHRELAPGQRKGDGRSLQGGSLATQNGQQRMAGNATGGSEAEADDAEREVLREGEEPAPRSTTGADYLLGNAATLDNDNGSDAGSQTNRADKEGTKEEDGDAENDLSLSPDRIREAEYVLLRQSPEVRCFMYDAMTASLFHSSNDLRAVEVARRHTFYIGANVFGISFDELTALWRVVEAELLLKKEKIKVLGQPWSE